MSYSEVYRLPVTYRRWYLDRLLRHFDERNKPKGESNKPVSNQANLGKYEEMLNNKFK
jgi:hypothetical protein